MAGAAAHQGPRGCRPGWSLCLPDPAGSAACAVETRCGLRVKCFIFWQTEKSALNLLLNLVYPDVIIFLVFKLEYSGICCILLFPKAFEILCQGVSSWANSPRGCQSLRAGWSHPC